MSVRFAATAALVMTAGFVSEARSQTAGHGTASNPKTLPAIAEVLNGHTELVTYRGARAVKLVPSPEAGGKDEDMLAIVDGPEFKNGTILIDVAGAPRPGTPPDSRGFIGVSFRTGEHGAWSDVIYLRPTNGRADDQLRRNHAVQYASDPEFPWYRLRQESPGVYESYADMEAGAWTAMRIEVAGTSARLYINGAAQPCLIVNDLKLAPNQGRVALWVGPGTEGYFANLKITAR